ncbi:hypothetical protein VP01_3732g1, partial [Puccinia sorghi]
MFPRLGVDHKVTEDARYSSACPILIPILLLKCVACKNYSKLQDEKSKEAELIKSAKADKYFLEPQMLTTISFIDYQQQSHTCKTWKQCQALLEKSYCSCLVLTIRKTQSTKSNENLFLSSLYTQRSLDGCARHVRITHSYFFFLFPFFFITAVKNHASN